MFEAHVLHLLRKYLGEYVHGLSSEALRISVWKGDVVLKDLKLKAEALNALKLPVTVKSGFVGTITLKVPWKRLGKEPVIVLVDRVFILAHPAPDGRSLKEEDCERLFEAKLQQIEEAEAATLEAVSKSKLGNQAGGSSWLGNLISTVIGNLKISITNVHIRYEDSVSNPGNSFGCGVTLAKLAAVTMDEKGNETFDTSGALDKLRKSLQLERLAMYHDSNRSPWKLRKKWEDLTPNEWVEVFEDGIRDNGVDSTWAKDRNYVVSPINGVLKYHRLGNQERNNPDVAFENALLTVSDVSVTVTEAQYQDWIRLMEVISRYKTYVEIFHLRPSVPVSQGCAQWWRFAAQASLQLKKMSYRFSWDQIKLMCHLRRRYINLYAASLQQTPNVDNSEIRNIEKDLDPKVILLWRFLAHAKVKSVKSKEAAEQQKMQRNSSWFSFGWRSGEESPTEDNSEGPELLEERLTKEEWQAINNLVSFQPDEDSTATSGKDMQNMIQYLIDVSIGQASARIINYKNTEIVSGRFEQLHVSTKFKQRSTHCDVKLKFYGFSVPEGCLAQSVSSEQKENALAASFVQSPVGENLDWSLSATTSPCHVTVFMESYDRFLEFMKRCSEVSPTVALETATALQHKIEKVTRKAQEQFQMVLEEQSRFALDIDLDAPKVRVPLRKDASSLCDSHFLLDLGHLTLQTKEDQQGDVGQSLYSRLYICVKDIAALFTDCGSDSQTCTLASITYHSQPPAYPTSYYSLIDKCGVSVIVDQIKIPCPRQPSTRVSVQVPTLGIHFSNTRFCRLMDLINILCGTMKKDSQPVVDNAQPLFVPWNPPDLASDARVLVWKGIGYTVAAWQPCYLVLSGLHLYVLESEVARSYQRCSRMAGKQVCEVLPANIGGSAHCIAVSVRGIDYQKALESFSTLIIRFRDDEEKAMWLRRLTQATYKASAPSSVDILGEPNDDGEFTGARAANLLGADLVVSGTLVEMKLLLYGKAEDELHEGLEETLLIKLVAGGVKVHIVTSEGDLAVKVKLHSLKIKDELQGKSSRPQYLACSVLNNEHSSASHSTSNLHGGELRPATTEDDDVFEDALPDITDSDKDLGTGRSIHNDVFYEAQDTNDTDFVSLIYITRAPGSPDYDGIDTQMSIHMSKLEFFCNRPTLVALIGFGLNLGSGNHTEVPDTDAGKGSGDAGVGKSLVEESPLIKDTTDENLYASVRGLLGYGKRRIIFNLNMNFDSVSIFLNKEDGSQLAMLVQERFVLDLKVHPSSICIEGTLGNLRLCDLSLGTDHRWGWLCDIRNQGSESLIQFRFNSYSAEDDDYEGYDYSLHGRLSAVRIVFLYKFVQEISTYFMGLAAPHTEEAVKFVDKVGGIEWLIEKYEVDGASALKLDLALDTPIIIVPLNSTSKDFMQLDLGHLQVTNEITWHGCPDKDPSAVHLDVLDAEIIGMNMAVGINGSLGKPMIREGEDIHIYVRRSLRDVFRKIPTFSLEVKVGSLHAVVSDKEYNVILSAVSMNLNEPPNLPPNFRGSKSQDSIKLLADKVNLNSQVFLSRTVTIMAVEVNYALLELCNGIHEESPLARLALEGLWVSYRMTSLSEADLYVTIPKLSIMDIRPGTKPEMRLMLGSCSDVPKHGNFLNKEPGSKSRRDVTTTSIMFLMDYRWRLTSQSWVIRLQQPRVLVVPGFLLAVGEFFVPALGAITGREELMDPKNDPIGRNKCIVLSAPLYKQEEDVINLSPVRQLVADAVGIDEYTYDGCGKTICLTEEKDVKEVHSSRFQPIIIIGRGKTLRFINVKIENGSLLRKYAYLSNDSSYSVSREDGVEILLQEINTSPNTDEKIVDDMEELSSALDATDPAQNDSGKLQAFSFEAQVISPEFTFYDSTKSSLDDTSQGEKLVRAKMDFSFMYACKESDTWVRAHLKDLTVEAGSGLVILDPVDISGGYTSVKDKTNMSLISSDIYVHLSLSVISLFLNFQSQATAALQFGDADLLSPCTNFDRLWSLPKENGHPNNLTFWRPRAASNYVILGDCVTSRPIPPSQAVMAVSSAYGRVRKPLGYKLVGIFSQIQELKGKEKTDVDCSIWMPIAPPGYLALGCVAQIGTQPPSNHVVHCIRSNLVTSTTYSECIFSASSNSTFPSGFTIWRLDNFLGSFYAHPSSDHPPKDTCFDLNHLVLWNSSHLLSSSKDPSSDLTADLESAYQQQASDQNASASGWDVLRSVAKTTNCYMSTPNFERIWWDRGGDLRRPVSIWRPIPRPGYAIIGDCITEGVEPPALGIIFKCDNPEISARPVQFTKVAHIVRKGLDEAFFWYPIAPPGYASLGCLVSRTDEPPPRNSFCCPRMDLVSQANILDIPISRSSSSKASQCWSLWRVENQGCTFLARSDLKKPSSRLAFTIGDSVKPKTRDNVTAEMKLRSFSVTVLDSLCGMMTPLFDATITNLKLATHGRLDDMNAVLISSIAASTFNTQLEAWEPLVEPFDGIFKFETYDASGHPPARLIKRARIAATSILNINVSAANLDCLAETIISWGRHIELEQKAITSDKEAGSLGGRGDSSSLSALDEDDSQMVVIENKLGCDIYVRKAEQNSSKTGLLRHNDSSSLWVPPPRYSDRLNVADASREERRYVAVQIFEAEGLSITDDGNRHDFFCALRLLVDNQQANQQKIFPQSARTKCVRPIISMVNDLYKGSAKWNELFIFEVPQKGSAKLEIEVTNLGAKAGKGEVVGACAFSVGHGESSLKKVASIKMLHQASDSQNTVSYPLKGVNKDDSNHPRGCLVASTSYFERKAVANFQSDMEDENDLEREIGFWVGLSQDGAWEAFRSFLPLSVMTRKLINDFIAVEVIMKNGKKHAILRGLATVSNDSDVKLAISICQNSSSQSQSSVSSSDRGDHNTFVEEVFENQRFQQSNKRSGSRGNDPGRWSTRDYSYTSKDFFEPALPSGWVWASSWTIDKSQHVDTDGWFYGSEYHSLKWPPTSTKASSKSSSDSVRRRRWVRTRELVIDVSNAYNVADALTPGSSAILPWKSMSKIFNNILQVRPCGDRQYSWGQPVTLFAYAFQKDQPSPDSGSLSRQSTFKSGNKVSEEASLSRQSTLKQGSKISVSSFNLNQLEKSDTLVCCSGSGSKQFWLSLSTDASVLHTELNAPVYDWKISVNSPLKLENRLPCPAEFKILEKAKDGNGVERESGIISSRGTMHVYSADIRNFLYLTLRVQGCWVLEKDPVLILDLSSNNHVSSFWMVHQQRRRRLRVSVEHDMGGTIGAPKTVRFFVPYWISNDSSVPLAYRVVEIDPSSEGSDAKFGKSSSMRVPPSPGRNSHSQILESIEDTTPIPSMLSPQEYIGRGGVNLFSSRNDNYLSPRVGIAVAVRNSDDYSPGVSLLELERKQRVDVKAFTSDGYYYKLSALLNMTSDRTKVIYFQPQALFINRVGCNLCLQQCDTNLLEWIHPNDPPKYFRYQTSKPELLRLRVDGYKWSKPFSLGTEGVMCAYLRNETSDALMQIRVVVRSGTKSSRYEVIFRASSYSSPYRIENRSMLLPIRFRQVDGSYDSWQLLLPNAAASFMWEDLGRKRVFEIMVDGTDPQSSMKYNIDDIFDHLPTYTDGGPPARAMRVTVLKEEKINVVKISDWMPENEPPMIKRTPSSVSEISTSDSHIQPHHQQQSSTSNCEFHVIVEIAELGISVIDHTPEEILYLSVQSLLLSSSTGLGSGISRFKLRMCGIQVDNQLPLTPMPVLFRPQRVGDENDYILKLSMTQQSNGSVDLCVYPYIGIQGPENSAFLINVHEPIIWRIHGMIQHANLSRLSSNTQTDIAVSVDPITEISVLNISEIRFKFSMAMSPTQRPVGVLGFWSSLMTALGNTENMPIRINQRFQERVCMRQSVLTSNAISNIKKDLLSQPLQLLSGVDILGNASSALGHMSKGVAALSMDKKFINSRQRQENKGVEDIGDVIREGGGAFAKGLFRGVTGILTKPLEGAKASGVEGFVQGVGKGIIGAAAQPVSGVLDLLSKTTEGANAMRMKIASAIASEDQLLRRRLPRVIGGDNLLRPYDSYKAQGQVILQLAETGSFVDLFKVRGKFALSDAYEDHFLLPKGRVLVVTHRRVLLLQQPSNIIGQKKFNPARDPCSVTWEVLWNDLVTMELSHGKKDRGNAPHSRLILYLQSRSFEGKDHSRVIKCNRDSSQAVEVYSSIEQAMNTYGPRKPKASLKRNVTKPYASAPEAAGTSADVNPRDGLNNWSPRRMGGSASPDSPFGSNP
jgi:vacuolar protein sorting-associated protein 13A/C